jgi:flotillin
MSSSSPKRSKHRAAAEVFAQQNVLKSKSAESAEDYSFEMDDFALDESNISPEGQASQSKRRLLGKPKPAPSPQPQPREPKSQESLPDLYAFKSSEELQLEKDPIQVRETGFLFWKRVIVPPNAYVVHTRAGSQDPITLGLGISFRYNPRTDAYLVVPAAMQTIGVVSNCISQEKQGINVLAYVQWQISDFSIAYRKLDFSDMVDPLGIVNAQLREQADAAIKDKIATMSVEEVLTDKAPIIEELTRRLSEVTEGRVRGSEETASGLGITIVTVQLKEAFVSSRNLWENLQAPYRHEQERVAKISYLDLQEDIRTKQLATRQATETSEAETEVQIERVREEKRTEALELRLFEDEKRQQHEQESQANQIQREQEIKLTQARSEADTQNTLDVMEQERQVQLMEAERALVEQRARIEQQRLIHEATLKRIQFEHQQVIRQQENTLKEEALQAEMSQKLQTEQASAEREAIIQQTQHRQAQLMTEIERLEQEIRNLITEEALVKEWIAVLPELAESMPDVQEMKVLQMGDGDQPLATFLSQQESLFKTIRQFLKNDTPD